MGEKSKGRSPRNRKDITVERLFQATRLMLDQKRTMPLSSLITFLAVARWGHDKVKTSPLSIEELAHEVGVPYTTMSNDLRYLGEGDRGGERGGLNLVETAPSPLDRRRKVIQLTNRGRNLLDQITNLVDPSIAEEFDTG